MPDVSDSFVLVCLLSFLQGPILMALYIDLLSHDADDFVFCSGFRLREVLGWSQSSRLCMCIPTPTYTFLPTVYSPYDCSMSLFFSYLTLLGHGWRDLLHISICFSPPSCARVQLRTSTALCSSPPLLNNRDARHT